MSVAASPPRYRAWDAALLAVVATLILLGVYGTWMELSWEWTFWADWKDTVFWPLTAAPSSIVGIGAAQYLGWRFFRLPLATVAAVLATVAVIVAPAIAHVGFTGYPANFVWPTTLVPLAILLDVVLILTRSPVKTAFAGAFLYGVLFYTANSVLIEPFLQPVVKSGRNMTVADLQGFEYIRSSVPSYLRQIDVGGLRSVASQVRPVAALFTGLLCIGTYWIGVGLGWLLVVWPMHRTLPDFKSAPPALSAVTETR